MECPVLHNLVRSYQTHTHSKTCRKYKNIACRFNFGHFFTERTIIAKPLHCDVDKDEKKIVLKKREAILSKVKEFINKYLYPTDQSNFKGDLSVDDILESLKIRKDE